MSMIHYPIKKISSFWGGLSIEKKLACKITGASFIVLLFIISTIILSSYFYQMDRAYHDFQMQTQNMNRFDSFFKEERSSSDIKDIFSLGR